MLFYSWSALTCTSWLNPCRGWKSTAPSGWPVSPCVTNQATPARPQDATAIPGPEVLGTSLSARRRHRITQHWCGLQLDSQHQQRHKSKNPARWPGGGSETTPCSALIPLCNEKKSNCMNELGGVLEKITLYRGLSGQDGHRETGFAGLQETVDHALSGKN